MPGAYAILGSNPSGPTNQIMFLDYFLIKIPFYLPAQEELKRVLERERELIERQVDVNTTTD